MLSFCMMITGSDLTFQPSVFLIPQLRIPPEKFRKLKVYGEHGRMGRIAAYCDGSIWRMVIVVFSLELDAEPEMVVSSESQALKFFSKEELRDIEVVITHSDIVEEQFVNV